MRGRAVSECLYEETLDEPHSRLLSASRSNLHLLATMKATCASVLLWFVVILCMYILDLYSWVRLRAILTSNEAYSDMTSSAAIPQERLIQIVAPSPQQGSNENETGVPRHGSGCIKLRTGHIFCSPALRDRAAEL